MEYLEGDRVKIVCTITHVLGYSKEFPFVCPVDQGTKRMNNIQKVNSTVTYGKRITLMLGLGLIAEGEDDDGSAAKDEIVIDEKQKEELEKLIGSEDEALYNKILEFYKIKSLEELPLKVFEQCKKKIQASKKAGAK